MKSATELKSSLAAQHLAVKWYVLTADGRIGTAGENAQSVAVVACTGGLERSRRKRPIVAYQHLVTTKSSSSVTLLLALWIKIVPWPSGLIGAIALAHRMV